MTHYFAKFRNYYLGTIVIWSRFDRAVERELKKHHDISHAKAQATVDPTATVELSNAALHPLIVDNSTSGIDINARLRSEVDSDLKDAVERLAKAEAMCCFAGKTLLR